MAIVFSYCCGLNSDVDGPHTDRNSRDDRVSATSMFLVAVVVSFMQLKHVHSRRWTRPEYLLHCAVLWGHRVTIDAIFPRIHPQRSCKLGEWHFLPEVEGECRSPKFSHSLTTEYVCTLCHRLYWITASIVLSETMKNVVSRCVTVAILIPVNSLLTTS